MKKFFVISLILLVLAMLYTKEGFVSRCNYTDCKNCNNDKFCRWNKINKTGKCMLDKTKLIKAC